MTQVFSIPIDRVNDFKILIKSKDLNSLRLEGNPTYIGEKVLITVNLDVEQSEKLNIFLNGIYKTEEKIEKNDNPTIFSKIKKNIL